MNHRELFAELLGEAAAQALEEWQKVTGRQLLPFQLLTGGYTGAPVLIVIEQPASGQKRKLVLKVCRREDGRDGRFEPERQRKALHYNAAFAADHLVDMVYDPLRVDDDTWIAFYALAGVGLEFTPPLADLLAGVIDPQSGGHPCTATQFAEVCERVVSSVLTEWPTYTGGRLCAPDSVVTFLEGLLQGRHHPGGAAYLWAEAHWPQLVDPATHWLTIDGRQCPNPFALATNPALSKGRSVFALNGPSHGDLHPGNILVPVRSVTRGEFKVLPLSTFWLVDLCRFDDEQPLVSDPVHLVLSIAGATLGSRVPLDREALLRYVIDPHDASSGHLLPGWLQQVIAAIAETTTGWIEESFSGEWREQTLLAQVTWGLTFAGRRTTPDAHRRWFIRLAAHAGRVYLSLSGNAGGGWPPRKPTQPSGGPARRATRAVVLGAAAERKEQPSTTRPRQRLDPELARASDELAGHVRDQWRAAAKGRRLVDPAPIPVAWVRASHPVAEGPGTRDVAPPGILLRRGELADLLPLYYSLRSGNGRLLVTGPPGAGKSAAAILLAIDVLDLRAHLDDDADRVALAVPVLLTPHDDWEPDRQSLVDWMARRIATDYPLLGSRRRARRAAEDLIRGRRVALFLDGVDELPERTRALALDHLKDADFTVVVISRSADLVAAATPASLSSAIAVELQPVAPRVAATYLARCTPGAAAPGWPALVEHVRDRPDSVLTRALDSPLTLSLLRDTYGTPAPGAGLDVRELLATRFTSREEVELHLLGQVLPVAFGRVPGDDAGEEAAQDAQRWLASFAHLMEERDTPDLAWWRLPDAVPVWPRALVTSLLAGLPPALLFGLVGMFGGHLAEGVVSGLLIGPLAAGFDVASAAYGRRERRTPWGGISLGYGLLALLAGLLSGVLVMGFPAGARPGLAVGGAVGAASGVAAAREAARRLGSRGRPSLGTTDRSLSPEEGWHEDVRQARRFGRLMGLSVGATVGGVLLQAGASLVEVALGAGTAALLMPFAVVMLSPRQKTTLAALLLARRGRSPVQIVQFLGEARRRNVLRAAGPVYQFRHTRLQDVLAESWGSRDPERRPSWFQLLRTSLRPWGRVRVSFAALLRVKDDDRYVLVGTPVRPGCYGPPGGVFKHRAEGSRPLDEVGFREDRSPSHRDTMRFDLRGFVPAGSLRAFVRWFATGRGRETADECLRRELEEKLGALPAIDEGVDLAGLAFVPVRTVVEGPHRVWGRPDRQMRRIEVYDLDTSTPAAVRLQRLLLELADDPEVPDVVSASAAEIEAGWCDAHQIAPQSSYLIGDRKLWPDVPLMP